MIDIVNCSILGCARPSDIFTPHAWMFWIFGIHAKHLFFYTIPLKSAFLSPTNCVKFQNHFTSWCRIFCFVSLSSHAFSTLSSNRRSSKCKQRIQRYSSEIFSALPNRRVEVIHTVTHRYSFTSSPTHSQVQLINGSWNQTW